MKTFNNILILITINIVFSQVKPYSEPLSFRLGDTNKIKINNNETFFFNCENEISQYLLKNIDNKLIYLDLSINDTNKFISIYVINPVNNTFLGPYTKNDIVNGIIKTAHINTDNIIIEVNNSYSNKNKIEVKVNLREYNYAKHKFDSIDYFKSRENPTIVVTGYWPPTNEMIRHFSLDESLNPLGWQGDNWEDLGYDIISFFPTFDDPDCSNCGQGNGTLEVDYQDTSNDFWPIVNSNRPIAIITFSRGFNNLSWELEFNAYNRTNWIGDYEVPTLPTPNPPDENEVAFYLRNSNLPMNEIIENINNLNIGLDAYIDSNGDPGRFVSEFMAYHGTWYRDLNLTGEDNCIIGGHIHVGGQIDVETARLAANETVRTVITYLNNFVYTPGDVNLDDLIDILDLVVVMNHILGSIELTIQQTLASDLNEDEIINIQDIIILINIILNNS